jgi:hypothetical protein
MPETSISRGKYNYNKHQKEKQNKILQYYRRSFKSQLAPTREITRPRRTRKQHMQPSTTPGKLTKIHSQEDKQEKQELPERQELPEQQEKIIQKSQTKLTIQKGRGRSGYGGDSDCDGNESHTQTAKSQYVIMD